MADTLRVAADGACAGTFCVAEHRRADLGILIPGDLTGPPAPIAPIADELLDETVLPVPVCTFDMS
jgi:hypothetical protein